MTDNSSTASDGLRLDSTPAQPAQRLSRMSEVERARKRLERRIYWDVVIERPKTALQMLVKLITSPHYLMSVVRKHLHFGKRTSMLTTDRIVLEQQIFKHYAAQAGIRDILFVGCDADTAGYHELYFPGRRFVTLEPDESNRAFGATEHIVATLEQLGSHIPDASVDLIICNGVFGWGLDEKANCEAAFAAAHRALKPGGQLLVGWNDVPRRAPFPLASIESLSRFRQHEFPLFNTWRHMTDTVYRHTFDFYQK